MGNHDEAACLDVVPEEFNDTASAGASYAAKKLSADNKFWLQSCPHIVQQGDATFVHASLANQESWRYILSEKEVMSHFAVQKTPICFCGHTHKPMIWKQNAVGEIAGMIPVIEKSISVSDATKVLVNVGSVGQPRDGDARACYVIYDPLRGTVRFHRVTYDFRITKRKILRANLPHFSGQRLALGR
jgi:diadenosine tetraphosphatase ApaH/serine/threonine PP2A family protein phosphatase